MNNARYNLKMYSGLMIFLGAWDVISLLPKVVSVMAIFKGVGSSSPVYVLVTTFLFIVLLVAKLWLGIKGFRYVKTGSEEPTDRLVYISNLASYAVIASALLVGIGIFADMATAGALLPPAISLVVLSWYKKAAKQCMWR